MRRVVKCLTLALSLVTVSGFFPPFVTPLSAEDQSPATPSASRYAAFVSVKPGALTGRIAYADGKAPAAKVPVRLWSVEQKKFLHQAATDAQGAFSLPELVAGRYLLVCADRVFVDLRVDPQATLAGGLNVIIPRGDGTFAQMAPERQAAVLALLSQNEPQGQGGDNAGEGFPLRTLVIVGGGTATAVGAVALAEHLNDEDEDHGRVSP